MNTLRLFFVALTLLGPALTKAQSTEEWEIYVRGIKVHESLIDFIYTNKCDVGLVAGCTGPMSADKITELKTHLINLNEWKSELFNQVLPEIDAKNDLPIKVVTAQNFSIKKSLGKLIVNYNPSQPESIDFAHRIRRDTVLRLVMYDHFLRLTQLLSKANKINSILTFDTTKESEFLKAYYRDAIALKNWNHIQFGLNFLKHISTLSNPLPIDVPYEQYIKNSYTAQNLATDKIDQKIRVLIGLAAFFFQTNGVQTINTVIQKVSEFFGNSVGQIQTRDGKLKKLASDPIVMNGLKAKLKPLDILFEKTPFRLTDKFIPGHYGHVAIWLGSPEELSEMKIQYKGKEIDLISHPDVLPHLESLSTGKLIIEALREPGVTMNELEHFMDIDDLLIISTDSAQVATAEHVLKTIQQVGKPYDFNFDVETTESLVCSELVYQVFSETIWPVKKELGRYTISPDHVAWRIMEECHEPKVLYIDGEEQNDSLRTKLTTLLSKPNGISHSPITCN